MPPIHTLEQPITNNTLAPDKHGSADYPLDDLADSAVLPLSMVQRGQVVELVRVNGGRKMRKRLADLGLNPGMPLRVVQCGHYGPLILSVRGDSRLAIGRGMAHKIVVRPTNAG